MREMELWSFFLSHLLLSLPKNVTFLPHPPPTPCGYARMSLSFSLNPDLTVTVLPVGWVTGFRNVIKFLQFRQTASDRGFGGLIKMYISLLVVEEKDFFRV